jgi:hypothetical protein
MEPTMRYAVLVLAGLGLAGCSWADRNEVTANPPSVSYRVTGNDISQANVSAQQYCQRYNAGAQFQGLQPTQSGNVAVYACAGPTGVATSGSSVPPPYATPQFECATPMHQDRPGGTDYVGPPVEGCPAPRY